MERTQALILVGVAVVTALIVSVMVISKGADSGPSSGLPGLQETSAPWQPEYRNLAERIRTLELPVPGSEKFHFHTLLVIVIDGKQQPVPNNIGIAGGIMPAIHTHDDSGLIHAEADLPFEAKLGDVFGVWGVKFTNNQIGSHKAGDGKVLEVYVNGAKVDNPVEYLMKPHDKIVVGYGVPGSFPTKIDFTFPEGL